MRKKILLLPLLALACACTGYQTGKQTDGEVLPADSATGVVLDSISLHLRKHLVEGQDAPSYDIALNVLAAKGDDDASRLFNEELCRTFFGAEGITVDSAMHFLADSLSASYTADLNDLYDRNTEDTFTFQYTYDQKGTVDEDSYPGLAAYTMTLSTYLGGAHGSYSISCLNLNLSTGRAIRCADFFQKDRLVNVKQLVEKSFMDKNGCNSLDELVEKTSIGSLGEIYVNENFLLLADSVEFVYNPYDVAPWACGLITTRVAYSDLAPCINKDILPQK